MMRRTILILPVIIACLSLSACEAKAPSLVETEFMEWFKHHVTISGAHETNPLTATPANIETGKHVFGYYCVVCHGRDGQNTGVPFAANMSPPIPRLSSADVQRYTDGQLKSIIEDGVAPSGMPASRGILSEDEIWHIVIYLRHLPPAGSLGEPRAYSGDEF